ncbi:outer membrane family protein [Helicobacter suis]|uniref:Outer membrane protein HopG n=1 Tax=Helicobacter suis TaxID=104628 RepID=A0A6J4D218_9HELI|nr:outer membrane family protein [Helicobacter suis]BCD70860.1 Outer membrane protein HopG [Helicobacter suis]
MALDFHRHLRFSFLSLGLFSLSQINFLEGYDFKITGRLENFSKIGFNHSAINTKYGIYPTETFTDVVGFAQIKVGLLPKAIEENGHTLSFSLGGAMAGIPYDGTKYLKDQNGQVFGSVVHNFIGGWHGYFFNKYFNMASGAYHARPYVLDTAFLQYDYKHIFGFKIGRYEANIDFMSGSNQGFEFYYRPIKNLKLWWWSSYGRGLAFNSWIYQFYATTTYNQPNGTRANYGWHGITATYDYKNLTAQAFFYFSPKTYNAPGFKLIYDTNKNFQNVGFRSQTLLMLTVPVYDSGWYNSKTHTWSIWDAVSNGTGALGQIIGKYGVALNIRQVFWWNHWSVILGLYNTFGNPDAYLGSHTMPMGNNTSYVNNYVSSSIVGYDFWDNTAYDGLADALTNANTTTIYGSVGSFYKKFAWHIFGRVSNANHNAQGHLGRANEYSAALSLDYAFTTSVFVHFKLEYYGVYIHQGYQVGYFGLPQYNNPDFKANYQDRSHIMTNITLKF